MEVLIFTLFGMNVEVRSISDCKLCHLDVLSSLNDYHLRSSVWILLQNLTNPPHVALTIDCALSSDYYVATVLEENERGYGLVAISGGVIIRFVVPEVLRH